MPDVVATPHEGAVVEPRAHPRHLTSDVASVLRGLWYLRRAEHLGRRVRVRGRPVVSVEGRLVVADRVQLVSTVATTELAVGPEGSLEVGSRTLINYGTSISASLRVHIGAGCQIGTYCLIMDNDFHRLEPERRLERPPSAPVVIEDDVWLGGRVVVLPGVTIGRGSAVGVGSVVTRDIPPRTLAVGVPARPLRSL